MSGWWADDVATYLATQISGGVVGTNIFVGRLPDTAPDGSTDNILAIFERPGHGPLITMTGSSAPEDKTDRPRMQIRVRDMDYDAGRAKIWAAYKALQGKANTTLVSGGVEFQLINAVQEPTHLGLDEVQRHEWTQTFDVVVTSTVR